MVSSCCPVARMARSAANSSGSARRGKPPPSAPPRDRPAGRPALPPPRPLSPPVEPCHDGIAHMAVRASMTKVMQPPRRGPVPSLDTWRASRRTPCPAREREAAVLRQPPRTPSRRRARARRPDGPAMKKPTRLSKVLLAIGLGLAVLLLWRGCAGKDEQGPPGGRGGWGERPPTPVRVATAERGPLDLEIKALGTVTPLRTVTVRPRVEGELVRIAFAEGQQVPAGQLLAEVDPAPFQVRLAQAEGTQKQNLAELENTRIQLQRFRDLAGANYVSAQEVSDLQARVRQFEGRRESDQAAVDEARLQLGYTRITAPIDGRIGLRTVDVGNLVRAGDEDGIATITQTRPISVVFALPEGVLPTVHAAVREGQALAVQAWDRDERQPLVTGTLSSLDNRIDVQTGTLR